MRAKIEPGSGVTSLVAPVALRGRGGFLALVAAGPAVLLLSHLLPTSGAGLALRLAGAGVCVLLVPGALLLRATAWPSSPGVAVAGSFALSLVVMAFALALVFLVGSSILLAGGVLAAVCACAVVPAVLKAEATPVPRVERRSLALVLGLSLPLAGVVWWVAGPLVGDTYFHMGRVRKLAEFDTLGTLGSVNEFQGGELHPGYAFPLLHGAEALVARLGGVDPADVVLYLPAVLVPLALVLGYGAGAAVFRSWAGGLAVVAAQAGQMGLSRRGLFFEGTGAFETLAQPSAATIMLVVPAILALGFTFVVEGGWILLGAVAGAGFALAAIHPTYAPYLALVLGGFLLARLVLVRGWEPALTRGSLVVAAVLIPFGLLLVLLLPVVLDTPAVTPSARVRAVELGLNRNNFTELGEWFGYSPGAIARGGPLVVAGLLAVPLAGLAARRLWAALVLGGSLAVLAVLLTPPLFTALSEFFSVSQSRRLAVFLPLAFAVAGGCTVLSGLRAAGVALAAGLGVAFVLVYPGEFIRTVEEGGPEWTVAVAVVGGIVALVAGAVRRPEGPSPGAWAAAAAAAFVLPVVVAAVPAFERVRPITDLTPGVITAVRAHAAPADVVFSDQTSAFEMAAFAPVYINAGPIGNVTDAGSNRPGLRAAEARRFFASRSLTDEQRRAMLDRYGADWVLVDKESPYPQEFLATLRRVFEDDRFALYRAGP
jgi:hypothetical protein